eukprot:COSAG02_NODE_1165_length_14156_cov_58.567191_7_plen_1296_part_00
MGCGSSTGGSVSPAANETECQPPPSPDPRDGAVVASQAQDDRARVDGLREAKRLEEVEQAEAATRIAAVQRGKQDRARVDGLREAKRLEEVEQAEAAKMDEDTNVRLLTAEEDSSHAVESAQQVVGSADDKLGPLPPPPLPSGYSGRPQVISALLQKITTCKEGAVAVRGQGGLGKTTIASALVRQYHDELTVRFPDGIFWLTLGEQIPSVTGLQASFLRSLGEAKQQVIRDEMAGSVLVARCLASKRLLLVLDDVWTDRHAKMFCSLPQSGESGSVVMITTRIEGLLGSGQQGLVGEHVLGSFSDADGESLLRASAGASGWQFGDEAKAVLSACDRLPLAIAIVAGGITVGGPHQSWADVNLAVQSMEAETVVERAIDFNLASLDPAIRELYVELSIFPEDVWIPLAVLDVYCLHSPAGAVQELSARRLLAVRGDAAFTEIRLHDLQRAYVRDRTSAARQQELHGRLLSHYQNRVDGSHEWWNCTTVGDPDASFFCTWLAYHLVESRGDDGHGEAAGLLSEFAWLDTKLRATCGDVASILFDFRQFKSTENEAIGLAFGQCAHIVESEPDQLAFQLAGRLPQKLPCVAAARSRLEAGTVQIGRTCHVSLAPKPNLLTSTDGPLRQTMAAHTDWIRTLSVSADGAFMLSGSNDMTVKLWSLADAQLVHHMQAHQHLVRAVAFVGGSKFGCSCAEDSKLIVYDLDTGSVQREIVLGTGRSPVKIHCGIPVPLYPDQPDVTPEHLALALSSVPSSEQQIYVGYGVTVQVFDISTGKLERELGGAKSQIDDVAAASQTVACGCVDGTILVWKGQQTSAIHTLACPDECRAVSLSQDGLQLLAACDDTISRLWHLTMQPGVDVPSPTLLGSKETGHEDWIHCCALSAHGDVAVTGSDDGTLRMWRIPAKGAVSEVGKVTLNTGVFACELHADSIALSGSLDIKAWSIAQAEQEAKSSTSLGWHDGDVVSVAVADAKTGLSLGRTDGQLKVWNLTPAAEDAGESIRNTDTKRAFRRPKNADDEREMPTCLAVSDDGELVAVGTDEAAILIYELKAPRGRGPKRLWPLHEQFEPHSDAIRGLAFSGTGHDQLVAVSEDSELSVIDADSPSVDIRLTLHGVKPNCVAVGGGVALVGGWKGSLVRVDIEEGEFVDLLAVAAETMPQPMTGRVQSTAVSADGKIGLSATAEEPGNPQLWMWNLEDRALLRSWSDLSEWVSRGLPCLISDDATLGLSASWDERLHVWDFGSNNGKGKGIVPEAASLLQLDRHPTCLAGPRSWTAGSTLLIGDYEGGVHALRYTSS